MKNIEKLGIDSKTFRTMQRTKFLSFCHTITTCTQNYTPIFAPTSALPLGSYYETSFQTNVYSWNRAIDNKIKSGSIESAIKLFDEMPKRDVVSWNLIISGCARFGFPSKAMYVYNDMVFEGVRESSSTFSTVLSICSYNGLYDEGVRVHSRVIVSGLGSNIFVGSSLVNLYLHMGLVNIAKKLFDDLPYRNLATWNMMLRGLSDLDLSNELLASYLRMKSEGVEPNELSFCYFLNRCGKDGLFHEGKQLHCCVLKLGYSASSLFVSNALVDFYSACGCQYSARKSFDLIPIEDVISWNSLIFVYTKNGFSLDALEMFNKMQLLGKRPSACSVIGFLGLTSFTKNLILGKQIHACTSKMGFDFGSLHVRSALIDMYGKCGEIDSSVKLLEGVKGRSIECCNSLMTSLLHCGIVNDVVEMFGLMLDEGINFDEFSLSTTLKALSFSTFKSLTNCALVHCCTIKSGFETHLVVSCSLIDTYSKCGFVTISRKVFDQLPSPNSFCFTSIITGYARNGMGNECLKMFDEMISTGLKPDKVTFLSLLSGCNHSGLVEEGKFVFNSMRVCHGIEPDREHYSCLVDLLGRGGFLKEAEDIMKRAPKKGDFSKMLSTLIRSCRVHKNEEVGKRAIESLILLEPDDHIAWLEASRFYSEIGDFENSVRFKELAMARKVAKEIGYSLIEVNDSVYEMKG